MHADRNRRYRARQHRVTDHGLSKEHEAGLLPGLEAGSALNASASRRNLGRLLRLAQDHPKIFSKDALARRKQGAEKTPPDWLDSYLKHVYVPKPADFR